jgi:hypothetical protein
MGVTITLGALALVVATVGTGLGVRCYRKLDEALSRLGNGLGLD